MFSCVLHKQCLQSCWDVLLLLGIWMQDAHNTIGFTICEPITVGSVPVLLTESRVIPAQAPVT